MKRLSGGLVLLNLTAISLALTSGEVDITDAGILEELTELRQFIDVNRDFSKGFKNLKPIMIEYRSSASKFNGITQANLSFNTDALHMSIGANTIQADGKLLVITINVVYEYTDYVGYTIKSAKINAYTTLAYGDGTFTGDVGIGGDLEVTGDAVLPSINGETDPSVKPVYCHPIQFDIVDESDNIIGKITMLIFNNDSTPFTASTFVPWLDALYNQVGSTIRIMCSGAFIDDANAVTIASYLGVTSSGYVLVGIKVAGGEGNKNISTTAGMIDFMKNFNDGVNKIN